jgi:hypothetical protein
LLFLKRIYFVLIDRREYISKKNEDFFTNLLTDNQTCGIIDRAWVVPCCGDADAVAEAPPRLTFSLSLA